MKPNKGVAGLIDEIDERAGATLRSSRCAPVHGILVSVVVLLSLLATGCSTTDGDAESRMNQAAPTPSDALLCGLVSEDLVRRLVPQDPIGTSGKDSADDGSFARCRVVNDKTGTIVMQLSIGRVDPAKWGPKLAQERSSSSYGHCSKTYDGDPGTGYGCTYESGIYAQGASVYVIQDDFIIRSTIYNWSDAGPEQRLALAEDVVREMEKNFSDA